MAVALEKKTRRESTKLAVIDCDIHNIPPSEQALTPYLPKRWRRHHQTYGKRNYTGAQYPRANPSAARADSWPPSGTLPGSDLDFMRKQLLDPWDIEYGILSPLTFGSQTNFEYSAARAQAMNEWQIAEWTEPEPRLLASMIVPYEDGELAAAEIRRIGDHPGFAQILILAHTLEPLGRRKYWRLYEAAVEHDLAIAIHFGGAGGVPITGAGWGSFYLRGTRRHAHSLSSPDHQPCLRGRIRSIPNAKGSADRGRFRLDAVVDVAARPKLEGTALRGSPSAPAAFRVHQGPFLDDHPAGRRTTGA